MVASPSTFQSGTIVQVRELGERMEQLAEDGDWPRVQAVMNKLNQVLELIPHSERREALLAASNSIDNVRSVAEYARRSVVEKLSAMRRGRKAQHSYEVTGQTAA